jgi:predicted TIM-barrel fold metal-dependent hydrolase
MAERWLCRRVALMLALAGCGASLGAQPISRGQPVIDMHLHTGHPEGRGVITACPGNEPMTYPAADPKADVRDSDLVQCEHPMLAPATALGLRDGTIAELRRNNVRRAVLAGPPEDLRDWSGAAPGLFIPAAVPNDWSATALAELRRLHASGHAAVFAEVGAQYAGLRADDPQLEPFWAMAEELDVPVGIHLGEGMPGQGARDPPDRYRASLISPFQLEEVLIRHPRLRLYVMHAASPLTDQMIAMLFEYPTLYVDMSANDWNMPRAQFYGQLKRLVDAGFSKRILFGSDQTLFPQAIGLAIETFEEAPFLTPRAEARHPLRQCSAFPSIDERADRAGSRALNSKKGGAEAPPFDFA